MTAPERLHRTVAVHPGSDLAVKDTNKGWLKIHRVQHITRLSVRESGYNVVCGLHIETEVEARPLSSGWLGKCCSACWPHLVTEVGAA